MNKPTDYPLDSASSDSTADTQAPDMTYAALRDRVSKEKPVTDEMISIARTKMETAHVNVGTSKPTAAPFKSKLTSIKARFKAN